MATVPVSPAVGWASFDPYVVLGEVDPSSATAVSKTTDGRQVRVALRFATPPAASYVHLDIDDRYGVSDPTVITADGGLLLINMPVKVQGVASNNFFVCKAGPGRPWLQCLPSLGGWMGVDRYTGVALCGENDFVVADLQPRPAAGGEIAELFRYSSTTMRWELKRFDMPPGLGMYPMCWETDAVFSFRGFMCWADYHRGIMFCDVSSDHPDLRFIRFPGIEIWYDFQDGRGLTEMYRTASVSQGRLWFVDVDNGRFRSSRPTLAPGTITTWTLKVPELEWVKQHTLNLIELWSHWKYQISPLPRSVPGFPIVDMQRADVLHFIVRESVDSTMDWTITVDMKHRCLMGYEVYHNDMEKPEGCEMDISNMFAETPLVCCQYA